MPRSPHSVAIPQSPLLLGWHVLRQHRSDALLFVTAGVVHAVCHGAVAWCAASLGRTLIGDPYAMPFLGIASAAAIASMGLIAVAAKGGAGILAAFAQTRLAGATGQRLRDVAVEALLRGGASASAPTTVARIVTRIREAEDSVQRGAFASLRAVAQLVPVVAGLWFVSPRLTLGALLVLAPFTVALSLARRRARTLHAKSMSASDTLHEEMDDLVRHTDLWRTYGTGNQARAALSRLGTRAVQARVRSDTLGVALSSANEVLGAAALILVLLVASRFSSWLDSGQVIAFVAIFFMAYRPLRDLGDARASLVRGREALSTLSDIALEAAPSTDAPAGTSFRQGALVAHELSVPGRAPAVSLSLAPGSMVALAGPTGAGKTTLLRAIMGLEPDARGELRYDEARLEPGKVGPSCRPFAWVPQDAPVISGSLDDNFRLAGADRAHADAELEALGAMSLREAVGDERVGQTGRALSGGERRWVALARALATGLPVMILDEPTVGLDPEARERVMRLLERTRGKRSVLVASHNEQVLAMADRVIRVEVDASR